MQIWFVSSHVLFSIMCLLSIEWATNSWNQLPEQVVDAPTPNCFKVKLDKLWSEYRYSQHLIRDYYLCHSHQAVRPDLHQAL